MGRRRHDSFPLWATRLGEEVLENGPLQDQVVGGVVTKEVCRDHVKWKGVKRIYVSIVDMSLGDGKFLTWVWRKVQWLCRDRGDRVFGLGENS